MPYCAKRRSGEKAKEEVVNRFCCTFDSLLQLLLEMKRLIANGGGENQLLYFCFVLFWFLFLLLLRKLVGFWSKRYTAEWHVTSSTSGWGMKSKGRGQGAWFRGKRVLGLSGRTLASWVNCFTSRTQDPPPENGSSHIGFCHRGTPAALTGEKQPCFIQVLHHVGSFIRKWSLEETVESGCFYPKFDEEWTVVIGQRVQGKSNKLGET